MIARISFPWRLIIWIAQELLCLRVCNPLQLCIIWQNLSKDHLNSILIQGLMYFKIYYATNLEKKYIVFFLRLPNKPVTSKYPTFFSNVFNTPFSVQQLLPTQLFISITPLSNYFTQSIKHRGPKKLKSYRSSKATPDP